MSAENTPQEIPAALHLQPQHPKRRNTKNTAKKGENFIGII